MPGWWQPGMELVRIADMTIEEMKEINPWSLLELVDESAEMNLVDESPDVEPVASPDTEPVDDSQENQPWETPKKMRRKK